MNNLFVIGNGFDLDHDLKTSYNDFRNYLLRKYPEIHMDEFIMPTERYSPDGGIEYNDIEVLSMLFYLINEAEQNQDEWNNIENALGYLNFNEAFDGYDDFTDKDGDIDWWKNESRNNEIASQLIIPTKRIQDFFKEWIDSIDINLAVKRKDFIKLLSPGDQFLTFNYTDTLEMIYEINPEDICHIHGKQNEEIFFGHGNYEDKYERYMQTHIGSQGGLSKIDEQLRKDTSRALWENIFFFENLRYLNIRKIYSYGFSFNKVDAIYIEEICKCVSTENVVWHFNDYDMSRVGQYKLYIKELGFKGNFDTFHISE